MNWFRIRLIVVMVLAVALALFCAYNEAHGDEGLRELHEFQSVEGLEYWLKLQQQLPIIITLSPIREEAIRPKACEDLAFNLRDSAYRYGWLIETEILTKNECIKYRRYLDFQPLSMAENEGHYIGKTVIGNEIYFIEPSNGNCWLAYYLDQ